MNSSTFSLVRLVVRGGVEPPTFRFSVVRFTVQDRPRRSVWLLSDRRYTPMDAGVRRCMRLEMRLCLGRDWPFSRLAGRCPGSFKVDRPSAQPGPGHLFMASTCALSDGDSRPATPHRVDGRSRTMPRGGITLSNGRVQKQRTWNRLVCTACGSPLPVISPCPTG